jgi:hypothetical protein
MLTELREQPASSARESDTESGLRYNARLSTSWHDVIFHSPRGIACFNGTLLVRRRTAQRVPRDNAPFTPTKESRHGRSRFHRLPTRNRTIGPDSPGTARRRQLPGARGRPPPRIAFMLKVGRYPVKAWRCSEFNALRRTRITRDIHGVTSLSTLNIAWEGVAVDDVLAEAGDSAPTPLALTYADDGYSNNVPIAEHPEAGAPARAASLLTEAIVTTVRLQTCAIPEIATRKSAINSWSFSPVRNVRPQGKRAR